MVSKPRDISLNECTHNKLFMSFIEAANNRLPAILQLSFSVVENMPSLLITV
jgi:hypothetical protein